ncbi:MAG: NusG domain II-containing protein [Clostridiales bacterium]|nr:NusG domain II-containing protein [Clostridiales bacterium]
MKQRTWIIIFSLVIIICLALWLLVPQMSASTMVAGIYQDGELVQKIDLNTVTEEYEITLSGDYGENVISVSPGGIKMKSADCPDKICVNHGELTSAGSPIVCLPNKIVIKFENDDSEADAISGEAQ